MDSNYKRNKSAYNKEAVTSGSLALSVEEVQKLLSVIDNIEHEVAIRIALDLGARRIDVSNIEVKNINFERGTIYYLQQKKRKWIERPIEQSTISAIRKWLKVRGTSKMWLFPSKYGNKNKSVSDRLLHYWFNAYMRKAGLIDSKQSYPFHALRSTCIQLKLQKYEQILKEGKITGVPDMLYVVANHIDDSIATVQKHYIGVSQSKRIELATNFPAVPE